MYSYSMEKQMMSTYVHGANNVHGYKQMDVKHGENECQAITWRNK